MEMDDTESYSVVYENRNENMNLIGQWNCCTS